MLGPYGRQRRGATGRQGLDGADAHRAEQPHELILDDVGERADDHERRRRIGFLGGQRRHERRQRGVLALREGGLDAAARIVEDADGAEVAVEPRGGAAEVELDHLGRAGAHEEQQLDVGTAREELAHHAVDLVMGVGKAGEIPLLDDGRGEARLGEDHHAGGRLDEMRAGARADHQEEGVLDLAMQPDDAGEAAEHRMLAAIVTRLQGGDIVAAERAGAQRVEWGQVVHGRRPAATGRSSRARLSL